MNISFSGNLTYTAPGGSSASQSVSCQATYTSQELGSIDIPSGTASGTAFQLPFGSVASAKAIFVRATAAGVKLAMNGATGAPVGIASGGFLYMEASQPLNGQANTSAVIITVATADGLQQVDYAVWGD